MRVLDLFSGIGGFSIGLERAGMRTVAFCEIDPYCRAVLRKHWPDVPIHDDIRTLATEFPDATGNLRRTSGNDRPEASDWCSSIDVICGGFPCQPFSVAGKRRGAEDDRHLWPEMLRVIQAVRPAWVIGENVAGLINMGLDILLSDLAGAGFEVQPFVIPACAVDAPHRRDRLWICARNDANANRLRSYRAAEHQQRETESINRQIGIAGPLREVLADDRSAEVGNSEDVADANSSGSSLDQGCPENGQCNGNGTVDCSSRPSGGRHQWLPEPGICRVAHGVRNRVDRLRALGNAVVPQIPEIIGRAIMQAEGLT